MRKSIIVGVSVTPEVGLEVAQVDFATQTVLKYGVSPLEYNLNTRNIGDLDLFKEALADLFAELQIPKGSEVVLNIPTIVFRTNDYPASLDGIQISGAIQEELTEHIIFKSEEPAIAAAKLPNSSMQFHKIAYTAAQKTTLIEIAMIIKDLGYKLYAIDTALSSVFNALMYKGCVNVDNDMSWVLLVVDGTCCRIISMSGKDYVDVYEEKVSIGRVLDDVENYSAVINAVSPILKNLPSRYLCVVSKTNIISAEILASKLTYSAPIIHQEANGYAKESFINLSPEVDEKFANIISLDVIGASIYKDFEPYSDAHLNLFNKDLGDVYLNEQPPELQLGTRKIVLTNSFLTKMFILIAVLVIIPAVLFITVISGNIASERNQLQDLEMRIAKMQQYLKDNENVSSDLFNEGDEIRAGLAHNKRIYSYYTVVGTEIPKKLWLTHLKFGDKVTIEGQADNLESVYGFFRGIKDYDLNSKVKLQKLGLASKSNIQLLEGEEENGGGFDTDMLLTSLNADFYEFVISDDDSIAQSSKVETPQSDNVPDAAGLELIKE